MLVMQRLHDEDLAGRLLSQGIYEHLTLRAQETAPTRIPLGRGLFQDLKAGDYLMPTRLPPEHLQALKRSMGTAPFSAQYQQDPAPAESDIIRSGWIRYGAPKTPATKVVLSIDVALKTDPQHDWSVCTIWRQADGHHYLVDVWRQKVTMPDLQKGILALASRHSPHAILVEDVGPGTALKQLLHASGLPVIGRKATDPKEVRLVAVSPYFESGQVWLPEDASWREDLERELFAFPGGPHDDQVDSISQYLNWVRESTGSGKFIVDWGYGPIDYSAKA